MKKFLSEVSMFIFLLFALLKLVKTTVPYYWGNKIMTQKLEFLTDNISSYDVLFIGSSRTYRHIDSKLFQELTNKKTYNLGSPGMFGLETEYMIDNIVSNKLGRLEVYIQSTAYQKIAEKNLHSIRTNYYLDLKRTKRAIEYWNKKNNYKQVLYHTLGFIENQLCIGQLFDIAKYNFTTTSVINITSSKQNGFYSLSQELADGNKRLSLRKRAFQKKKRKVFKRKKKTNLKLRKISWAKIGIKNSNINQQIVRIKGKPVVESKYYFDKSHFNKDGAELYTKMLAKKYLESNKK